MIDLSLENPDQVYVQPVVNERPEDVLGMLTHDFTLATFSDSGAHAAQEMGSSLQTHFIHYWVNRRGAFTLEQAVRKMTHDNARAFELKGRGLVKEGYSADLVLFEADRVRPQVPKIETDLPGRRPPPGAEGRRDPRDDRQWRRDAGERRIHRTLRRRSDQGPTRDPRVVARTTGSRSPPTDPRRVRR